MSFEPLSMLLQTSEMPALMVFASYYSVLQHYTGVFPPTSELSMLSKGSVELIAILCSFYNTSIIERGVIESQKKLIGY
jgi:hypothetical protein